MDSTKHLEDFVSRHWEHGRTSMIEPRGSKNRHQMIKYYAGPYMSAGILVVSRSGHKHEDTVLVEVAAPVDDFVYFFSINNPMLLCQIS